MIRAVALLMLVASPALAQGVQPGDAAPRLTGVVLAAGHRTAIFQDKDGATVAVGEGDTLDGLLIQRIEAAGVQASARGRLVFIGLAGASAATLPADTGGVTFGLVVNPPAPAPD